MGKRRTLLALLALMSGVKRGARAAEPGAVGFDHMTHAGRIEAAGGRAACTDCHPRSPRTHRVGRPGHAQCYGSCHSMPAAHAREAANRTLSDEEQAVCNGCHPTSQIAAFQRSPRRRAIVPPSDLYARDPDFALGLSHKSHASIACRRCHPAPGRASPGPKPRSHRECAQCHDSRAAPGMHECRACHRQAVGPDKKARIHPGAFPVGQRFSHQSHRPHDEFCTPCHEAIRRSEDQVLEAPDKASCRVCHDGGEAFSTTSAQCRRCHARPARTTRRIQVARPSFSHAAHLSEVSDRACTRCHGVSSSLVGSGDGHQSCDDSACHAADFGAADSPICAICHVGSEPWRKLHLDRARPRHANFGMTFSHRSHRQFPQCRRCHRGDSSSRGHAACEGAGCHAEGQRPMSACTKCHDLGQSSEKRQRAALFAVGDTFDHGGAHRAVKACTRCHPDPRAAGNLAEVPTPSKTACAPCHDGSVAFSMTGHACARCHSRSEPRPR